MSFDYRFGIRRNPSNPPDEDHQYMTGLDGHMGIVGVTGSGKSNYIKLILHRLEERDCNVVLLDPHASVTDYALSFTSKNRVLISGFDYPGSEGMSTGINALQHSSELDAERVSDWLIQMFSTTDALSNATWGGRLGTVFGPLLIRYMIKERNPTLEDFAKFISNRKELNDFTTQLKDFTVVGFLGDLLADRRHYLDFITSSMNKLAPIIGSEVPRRVLCKKQTQALDLDAILQTGNNLIVPDLNQGRMGKNTVTIITGMILARIWSVLLKAENPQRKTYIIIDEAEVLPLDILNTLLLEGRKFGVVLILSFHTFSTLDQKLPKAMFPGILNWACMKLAENEANIISRNLEAGRYRDDLREALMKQDLYCATVHSIYPGGVYGPLTLKMPYVPDANGMQTPDELKASLLNMYGSRDTTIRLVEKKVTHRDILSRLNDSLKEVGIHTKVERKFGHLVPDLQFKINGIRIFCEVECNDLYVTDIIMRKLYDYRHEILVFVCRYEDFPLLIQRLQKISDTMEVGKSMHRLQNIYAKGDSILRSLPTLHIVVYYRDDLYFFNGSSFVEFSSTQVLAEGSLRTWARRIPPINSRSDIIYKVLEYIGKGRKRDDESILKALGSETMKPVLDVLKERGYDQLTVTSFLELDRLTVKLPAKYL